jgi:hypothetical protein
MTKIRYTPWRPGINGAGIIRQANTICAEYAEQGYDLTLRQLYYQFVARAILPNTQQSYKRLGDIVNKARLAGLMDWNYIVDRTRNLRANGHWDSPEDIIYSAAQSFAHDKWSDQPVRVEVWVEKEALAGIVSQVSGRFDCAWFSCRGYVSQSELWAAGRRHLQYLKRGQRIVVVHLGDHDPSGLDMTRDIRDRLDLFTCQDWLNEVMPFVASVTNGEIVKHMIDHLDSGQTGIAPGVHAGDDPITVQRIALNMDQVEQYDPPPNPAKLTDSRATAYIDEFGPDSWELDALDPATLADLIESAIVAVMDANLMDAQIAEEERERDVLNEISQRWDDVREFLDSGA